MMKIVKNNSNFPRITIIIKEKGFVEPGKRVSFPMEFDELFGIIEKIGEKNFPSTSLLVSTYDDAPVSMDKSISFFIDAVETINLVKEIQVEFNKLFGHENVFVSLF